VSDRQHTGCRWRGHSPKGERRLSVSRLRRFGETDFDERRSLIRPARGAGLDEARPKCERSLAARYIVRMRAYDKHLISARRNRRRSIV
jgi:hypothetical protein